MRLDDISEDEERMLTDLSLKIEDGKVRRIGESERVNLTQIEIWKVCVNQFRDLMENREKRTQELEELKGKLAKVEGQHAASEDI